MSCEYTPKQKQAIEATGRTLVTAAAGSGKTRVLTSRIVKIIHDGGDIRDMMIATFTNAAAAEMKSRISEALSLYSNDERMRRQAELVTCARIGTYHNFCIRTLRENYIDAHLPYNFRVIDNNYSETLQNRVVNEYLMSRIEEGDGEICRFIERFSKRFSKNDIVKYILKVYKYSVMLENPEEWLEYAAGMSYERYCELCGRKSDALKAEYDMTMPDVRTLVRMTKEFAALYSAEKSREAMLDFDDLLRRTYELLQHKTIKYKYVFVDEYQDTNPVQDAIIRSITDSDIFIVGDKKQSIYRFNYADPRIFKDREKQFGEGCIAMNDNFRSSPAVIDAVNSVMSRVMTDRLGDINYEGDEMLVSRSHADGEAAFVICQTQKGAPAAERRGMEASMIASMISSMMGREYYDGQETKRLKPGDFAVLYRSCTDTVRSLKSELENLSIPYTFSDSKEGKASECAALFMDMLKVICSPERDIPLLAVMRYPGVGFRDSEFATIRKCYAGNNNNEIPFSEACRRYAEEKNDRLAMKISALSDKLEKLRLYFDSYNLADFLYFAAQEFSLFDYALLRSRAEYKALFSLFDTISSCGEYSLPMIIRYMEDYRSQNNYYARLDVSRDSDSVSIMTIHKSKGLEFPVVFVVGTDNDFNFRDLQKHNHFMIDSEFGIMPLVPVFHDGNKSFDSTVIRSVCAEKVMKETKAEEARLLYVAMTRAENYLYLTGTYADSKTKADISECSVDYSAAKNMLDFLLWSTSGGGPLKRTYYSPESNTAVVYTKDETEKNHAAGNREWIIFDEPDMTRAAYSVSEIKKDESGLYFVPEMFDDSEKVTGADLGTVVHSIMEKSIENGNPEQAVLDMENSLVITSEEKKAADDFMENIKAFFASDIYARIRKSSRVLTEQPFLVKRKASDFGKGNGMTMLHGVIDLAFEEDGEWVILDYKTDRITESNEQSLISNYSVQLKMYADALSELTGMKTKEKVLYFLRTGKAYSV